MSRYYCEIEIRKAHGTATVYVEAESPEEAMRKLLMRKWMIVDEDIAWDTVGVPDADELEKRD